MPSPFPGMNPYLEQDDVWHDFHARLLAYLAERIGAQLPSQYVVKIEKDYYPHSRDIEKVSYLQLLDNRHSRPVTYLEVLSPTNKNSGPNREEYLGKRRRALIGPSHLVEIDLLRGGPRMPFARPLPECAYYVLVRRLHNRPTLDFWPIGLRDPLPVVPIPLGESDAARPLDLQAALHHVYDAARYGNYIYEGVSQPPLNAADEAWARQIIGKPT